MNSLLIGNGINIQFGGKAYSSDIIIKRAYFNAIQGKYAALFSNIISNEELGSMIKNFITVANKIIDCKFDYVADPDLQIAITEFKNRYSNNIDKYSQIMLEDWFLLLKLFFLENSDVENHWQAAKKGFEQMFLDAIYNEGDVEKIQIPKSVAKYLKKFDKIFTLNYDSNLENLTGKQIFHLHGCFNTLADSENDKTVLGYMRHFSDSQVIQAHKKHCFCNALLDFSGSLKMKRVKAIDKFQDEVSRLRKLKLENQSAYEDEMLQLKENNEEQYNLMSTAVNNEALLAGTNYHFEELKSLTGDLTIIGMSPNNDFHIFDSINNSNVENVYFYNWGTLETQLPIHRHYQILDVEELWSSLNASNKKYNNNFKLPNNPKVKDFLKVIDTMSLDEEPDEKIIDELNSIPQYEIDRLCKMYIELFKQQSVGGSPQTAKDLKHQCSEISSIALRAGVHPKTLYLLIIMNIKNYK